MLKILITGANGYLGQGIVKRLLDAGLVQITNIFLPSVSLHTIVYSNLLSAFWLNIPVLSNIIFCFTVSISLSSFTVRCLGGVT